MRKSDGQKQCQILQKCNLSFRKFTDIMGAIIGNKGEWSMSYTEILSRLKQNVAKVIVGKEETVDYLLCALLCSGHVLIEDMPGLGKTSLASALAASLGCSFRRIQFTPDVVPSDITGFTMFNMKTGEKEIRFGSVMSQIVLADEINRCGPKTQSALLEVMQERQVTIDGETFPAPMPFMVLATQNPIETSGTYPLPEAQLDRFMMRLSMGYPSQEEEIEILRRHREPGAEGPLSAVITAEELCAMQRSVEQVICCPEVMRYIVEIAEATRDLNDVRMGISPRGSIALLQASRARALMQGRDYVLPDDVRHLVRPVLSHRLLLRSRGLAQSRSAEEILDAVLQVIPVPVNI